MIDNIHDSNYIVYINATRRRTIYRSDRLRRDICITLATQTYVAIRHTWDFLVLERVWYEESYEEFWFFVRELKPRTNAVLCNCQNLLKYFLSLTLSARFRRSKKTAALSINVRRIQLKTDAISALCCILFKKKKKTLIAANLHDNNSKAMRYQLRIVVEYNLYESWNFYHYCSTSRYEFNYWKRYAASLACRSPRTL